MDESLDGSKTTVIKWDEVTIAEHDKERGTRQVIDEPPTPFAHHTLPCGDEGEISQNDMPTEETGLAVKRNSISLQPTNFYGTVCDSSITVHVLMSLIYFIFCFNILL